MNFVQLATVASGRPVKNVEFIRRGTHDVYRSLDSGVLLRVQHVEAAQEFADNLHTVRSLVSAGAPLVAPLTPGIAYDAKYVVTAWELATPAPLDTAGLGRVLRQLHDTPYGGELPALNIHERFDERLQHTERTLGTTIVDMLLEKISVAQRVFDQYGAGSTVLHADAHGANLVHMQGVPYLVDLDDLAYGAREFDLLPSYTAYIRMHRDEQRWTAFRDGYGAKMIDWDVLEQLRIIRETTMNTWLSTVAQHNDAAYAELIHRLSTWDTPPFDHAPWSAI